MSLPSDVTVDNLKDFYAMILPYLNVGNGGTSDTPLGQVAFFDDTVAPAGWLIADGTVYNISDYPDLANQYERVHGSKNFYGGNGTTTFAVPNWQGEFLRASGTNSHTNQGSGAAVGVHQDATEHMEVYSYNNGSIGIFGQSSYSAKINEDSQIPYDSANQSVGTSNNGPSTQGRYTSRPTNTSLLLCIKAVPSSEMNTYSTTEIRKGTWIDGKPLYQKTWTGLTTQSGADAHGKILLELSSLNIKDVIKIEGFIGIGADYSIPINCYNDAQFYVTTRWENDSSQAQVRQVCAGWYNRPEAITMQYTKTTD